MFKQLSLKKLSLLVIAVTHLLFLKVGHSNENTSQFLADRPSHKGYPGSSQDYATAIPNVFDFTTQSHGKTEEQVRKTLATLVKTLRIPVVIENGKHASTSLTEALELIRKSDPAISLKIEGQSAAHIFGMFHKLVFDRKQLDPMKDTHQILVDLQAELLVAPLEPGRYADVFGVETPIHLKLNSSHSSADLLSEKSKSLSDLLFSARKHLASNEGDYEAETRATLLKQLPIGSVSCSPSEDRDRKGDFSLELSSGSIYDKEGKRNILSEWIRGTYPISEIQLEKSADPQFIQNLGVLLEIPYLKIDQKSRARVETRLRKILASISTADRGKLIEFKQAFESALENARFGGGANRLLDSHDPIDALLGKIAKDLTIQLSEKRPIVPRYATESPNFGSQTNLDTTKVDPFLVQKDQIAKAGIQDGFVVFHGTTTANIAYNIARNGPILAGTSDGSGCDSLSVFYTSPSFQQSYCYGETIWRGSLPTVLTIKCHPGADYKIFDQSALDAKFISDGVDSLEKFRAHPLSNLYTQTPEGPSLDTKALAKRHGVHAHVNQLEFLSKLSTDGKTRNCEEFHLIKLDHAQFPDGIANILRENMRWLGDKSCGSSAGNELSNETRKAIERFEKILKYFQSERGGAL